MSNVEWDRQTLVRTGLAAAALLALAAATAAVAKGGADPVEAGRPTPDNPAVVVLMPSTVPGPRGPTMPPDGTPITPETAPRLVLPAVSATTAATTATAPPTAATATTAVPVTTAATTTTAAPEPEPPADVRCAEITAEPPVRDTPRSPVLRVSGVAANCGPTDLTFVVQVTDVSNHTDPGCNAGTRMSSFIRRSPGTSEAWSVMTNRAPCPGPYTLNIAVVDLEGEVLAGRNVVTG